MFVDLFVHSYLLDPQRVELLFGRSIPIVRHDTASGFMPEQAIDVNWYPSLSRNVSSMVHGVVLSVHPEELSIIDGFETPTHSRQFIRLMSGKEAWIYGRRQW